MGQKQWDNEQSRLPEERRHDFDDTKSRFTRSQFVQMADDPQWQLSRVETAYAFDECIEWWKGSMADMASQSQNERQQLRDTISNIETKLFNFQSNMDRRMTSL